MNAWSFLQLRSFIEYEAKVAGVPLIIFDPRNTSLTCSECGCVEKKNIKTRDEFERVRCGFAGLANHVAAVNVAVRGRVNGPDVTSCLFDICPTQLQALEFIRG